MAKQRGVRWFVIGAWVVILFGLAHTMAIFNEPIAQNDTERQMLDLMQSYRVDLMGTNRSMSELMKGFNISLTLFSWTLGGLSLLLARNLHDQPGVLKKVSLANVASLACLLAVSILYWFVIPTAFILIALTCFAVASNRLRPIAEAG